MTDHWRQMTLFPQKAYPHVSLRGRPHSVSRLVLLAFVGPCPDGMECCHFPDPTPSNNNLSNLRWDTSKANHADRDKHGTMRRGERVVTSKLTEADVRTILADHAAGTTQKALAKKHHVSRALVCLIVSRKRWAHLEV